MISTSDLKHLKLAEVMSTYSDYNRVHIGACVIKKKKVIGIGCNQNKTHPLQEKYNSKSLNYIKPKAKLHAELDALLKSGHDAKGGTLYVFRRGRDNIYRMSKPCPACMEMIKDYGIKRIVYTIENGIKEMII